MRKKKQLIIVPGYGGFADNGWPSWLCREVEKCGMESRYLEMPDMMYPQVDEWLSFLEEENIPVDENTYLVGHSLGCITLARYLENKKPGAVAAACIMVSGFDTIPKIPLLSDFCSLPLNFEKVRAHAEEFVMIASDDDHLVPLVESEALARKLGAEMIVESGKGHFKSDVKELHSVLNYILEREEMRAEEREMKKLKKTFK
jgi:predicted alpha/beta hydrolase family esterase